jgi:hypothetical protein
MIMKPNSEKINDIVIQIFNKEKLIPGYPYLITSHNTNKIYTGTLSEIDDENHKLIFKIYDDNGELKTACISILGICQGVYTIEKPLPIDLNASDNEEDEKEPEEESKELKIYTRSICYHDKRNHIEERYVTNEENDLSTILFYGRCKSDDSILIHQFAYKVSYIDDGNIVKYEIILSRVVDENSKLPEGFRVHPMFWDSKANKFKHHICISKNVEHLGEDDLSISWTIQIASGLQMLYFIEYGLNSRPDASYHGIEDFINPTKYQYISNAKVDVFDTLIIDDEGTHISLPSTSGFIYSFYQDKTHKYDWLFIPCVIVNSNVVHLEHFCDSYYVNDSYYENPRARQEHQLSYGGPHDKKCEPYGPFTIVACDQVGFRHFDIGSRTAVK